MTDTLNKALQRVRLSPSNKNVNPSYRDGDKFKSSPKVKKDHTWEPPNSIFRRYANGVLDYSYARSKVFDALDKVTDGIPPTDVEKAALSILVPGMENLMSPGLSGTMIRLSEEERMILRALVIAKQKEILNWNAGMGGGSVPGRTQTKG